MGRKENGFHDLASLFQCIDLCDRMSFSRLPDSTAVKDEFTCSDSRLPTDGRNLVIKALNLMRDKTGITRYFRVHLDKHIPFEAGLGGGSGNAATAMFAFNALCDAPATMDELQEWAADIGSDISFFFSTGTAYCTGKGEFVQSLSPMAQLEAGDVHIFKPSVGLSTGDVFKTLDLSRRSTKDPIELLNAFTSKGPDVAGTEGCCINDLEAPSFQLMPLLAELKAFLLQQGFTGVMMSGSGTSIFALGTQPEVDGSQLASTVLQKFPGVSHYAAAFVNRKRNARVWYKSSAHINSTPVRIAQIQ